MTALPASFALGAAAAGSGPHEHLPWTRQATLYEVNVRQYTREGTLAAFAAHLPRLRALGVDILWLMPIQPIGKRNRKGRLGSYYSIDDYEAVNPEFGDLDALRALVRDAHRLGMRVMLDWVANHTAWDHPWTRDHKDWYKLDAHGEIYPVTFAEGTDHEERWTDVVALDYRSRALREAMIAAMAFWLRAADIDGFRCDVAGLVPVDFWVEARARLDAIKPVFMLAEASEPALHQAFDMSYGWDTAELMRKIAQGRADAGALRAWVRGLPHGFPADAYRMRFTTNHDYNSWNGSDGELYGAARAAMTVLTFTLPGMPLIYSGQEAGLDRRLDFFDRDVIDWSDLSASRLYAELAALKKRSPALAAGQYGGAVELRDAGDPALFAFTRRVGTNRVDVTVNLGAKPAGGLAPWRWTIAEHA